MPSKPKKANAVALEMIFVFKLLCGAFSLKITLFLCSHKVHIPNENKTFQLIPKVDEGLVH